MRCESRAPSSWLGYCRCELQAGHDDMHRCSHAEMWADKVDHELTGEAAASSGADA